MKVDLRIRNGRVIDPSRGIDRIGDILVKDGIIVEPPIDEETVVVDSATDINASNYIVTPGLIDFHAHVFQEASDAGIPPEAAMLPAGVTTVVDGGSSGTANANLFVASAALHSVRVKGFLHVSPIGQPTTQFHETLAPQNWDTAKMRRILTTYKDWYLGLKIRFSKELVDDMGEFPLQRSRELADEFGVPLCVHTTNPPIPTERLLEYFRPGDIFCHVFHGKGITVCENGKLKPAVREAKNRGVLFDACNGVNHFSFDTAEAALADGFFPDIISTDLTVKSMWKTPVCCLPYVLSKYFALGCDLPTVLKAATTTPAKAMNMSSAIGTLAPGALGDIAVFSLEERPVTFHDTFGKTRDGKLMLVPQLTAVGGKIFFRNMNFV